ncbi:hypothetical protein FA15DRAFT_472540 [Coprinopsis marcescibilis]|uniref:Uncharacterized protein n=1 Tax=Coprinopsis marcescibilis TaxID=230819 RepID=A0A5C3KSK1_COPMA|nr:hypothetical protein FA15DRAFT_472540 [Coprinopsis marcescibilis]
MSAIPRFLTFDDDHADIIYEGNWEIDPQEYEGLFTVGNFGGSQHRITGNGSLSLSFRGEVISLFGTNRFATETSESDLDWQCFVNGEAYPAPLDRIIQNGYQYCSVSGLDSDATHTLTVNVQASESAPFWADMINVYPTRNTDYHKTLSDYSAQLSVNDTSIRYGPGWEFAPGTFARFTRTPNSFMEMEFIGSQVIWRGMALANQSPAQSRATYSLDGGPPINFTIFGPRENTGQYTLFETEKLPRNRHSLRVVYEGFETPLALNLLRIAEGDLLDRDPRTLGPALDGLPLEEIVAPAGPKAPGPPIGAIVGGVVGGVVALLLIVGVVVWLLRKRKREREQLAPVLDAEPLGAAGFSPNYGAQTYSKAPYEPVRYNSTPPITQHSMGIPSSYAPSTSYAPSSTGTPSGVLPSKAQLASAQPAPDPVYYQDSGMRFNPPGSSNVENAVPPSYTPS